MEIYFTNLEYISESEAKFDDFETRHILKTMRKKIGDVIHFTDGRGRLFKGIITAIKPDLIVEHTLIKYDNGPIIRLTVAVGFIRHSRMDFIVEKGSELGINTFIFYSSKHSQYFTHNIDRWQRIARQAIKQSLRYHLPKIVTTDYYDDFLKMAESIKHKYLADQSATQKIHEVVKTMGPHVGDDIIIAIGPEGGLTQNEILAAQRSGFQTVSFGDFRLRTETAVLSAASYINLFRN